MKSIKKWKSFNFGQERENRSSNSNFNFFKTLEPDTVSDLAVHPKKIKEVETWLQYNVLSRKKSTTPILLVVGPTGCGKTTALNVICKSLKIQVLEWVNPIDREYEPGRASGQTAQLIEFLSEAKYPSLFDDGEKKITLIEDFPNSVIHNPLEFHTVLRKCFISGGTPVVFICTDSSSGSLNLAQSLFSQEIKDEFHIDQISFNPCSATILKGALKRAQDIMQDGTEAFKLPSLDTVNAIICSSAGDLRCAVNLYYFAALKGIQELPISATSEQKLGVKRKRAPSKTATIKSMMRDESLGLFHGLGRVLNPKTQQKGDRCTIQCDFNRLIDEFSSQPNTIQNFLFENYLRYFGDAEDVCRAAEVLSISEAFLNTWKDGYNGVVIELWFIILGLMVFNKHKVSKWNQLRAPTKMNKKVNSELQMKGLTNTDFYYYNAITKSSGFHNFG